MATYSFYECRLVKAVKGRKEEYWEAEFFHVRYDKGEGNMETVVDKRVKIKINSVSNDWKVGKVVTFFGKAERERKKNGTMVITPLPKKEAMEIIEQLFREYDNTLSAVVEDDDFVADYLNYARILGKEDYAKKRVEEMRKMKEINGAVQYHYGGE